MTNSKRNVDVVIYKNGRATTHKNVSVGKAFHIVDDFSVSINNGHLWQSKDTFSFLATSAPQYIINLSHTQQIFAVVGENVGC